MQPVHAQLVNASQDIGRVNDGVVMKSEDTVPENNEVKVAGSHVREPKLLLIEGRDADKVVVGKDLALFSRVGRLNVLGRQRMYSKDLIFLKWNRLSYLSLGERGGEGN